MEAQTSSVPAPAPSSARQAIGTVAGMVLGGVFLFAGFAKFIDPERFIELIEAKGLGFGMPPVVVAYAGIAIEVFLGTALVLGIRKLPILLSSLALTIFFVVMSSMAYYDSVYGPDDADEGCGCFGAILERTPSEAFWLDLAFLALAVLAFVGRPRASAPWPKLRLATAGLLTAASLGITAVAPEIDALDSIATKLDTGTSLKEVCGGSGEDKVCLSDMVPDWDTYTWLIVITDPMDPTHDAAINRYYDWHFELEDPDSAPELFWLHRPVTKDEEAEFKFPSDGRIKPKAENQDVPAHFLRGLYRRLPRGFLVRDGKVAEVWNGLPPFDRWMK